MMYLCRQVPLREDAEDVLLEVFQAAVESEILPTLKEGKQRTWLWSTAHNKVADHYRRKSRRPNLSLGLEEMAEVLDADDSSVPELVALRKEAYAELRTYIVSLPELQQEILHLRFAHGLNCSEIAQQLGKNHGATRTMLSRSLNHLRSIYRQNRKDQSHG
ncbi:sigma-70 family RNA polymerase sigma factor [Ktedonosporobacter rubrisoli]|uniref:Sigma-70 family RNA polymerase sigma factor n=2 Tax=Ktedonosporobacter rubrisoli TaxID=2509675 RepID=A0A4V0YZH0_KTERU|nr:sigma-70 family RNA polymerase sigma factor [Ktedonosporobacter rubrisoli]